MAFAIGEEPVRHLLYVQNAIVHTTHDVIADGAVLAEGGLITWAGASGARPAPDGARVIDASGLILAPGFIDLQINGGFGHDFTHEPDTIWRVGERLPAYGVTAFLPTIISSPPVRVALGQRIVTEGSPAGFVGAKPLGLHCEGPFLNPQKRGAHNPEYLIPPAAATIANWSPENGIRLVTLAPELPGALNMIDALVGRGMVVGAGPNKANNAEAPAGFGAGVSYGTHLFNAMPGLGHREPGLAGALLTDDRITASLIVDRIHVHPAAVDLAWRALGSRRLVLVSDAMAGLGMPAGKLRLGDYEVMVDGASCRLADGTLAGSTLSLDAALRNLIDITGCSLVEALPTVTATPAKAIGLGHERGYIGPGYRADLVLLSPDLHVVATIIGGEIAFQNP